MYVAHYKSQMIPPGFTDTGFPHVAPVFETAPFNQAATPLSQAHFPAYRSSTLEDHAERLHNMCTEVGPDGQLVSGETHRQATHLTRSQAADDTCDERNTQ